MIDRGSLAGEGLTLLDQQPNVARIENSFQRGEAPESSSDATKIFVVPVEGSCRIGVAQMHVVESEMLRVLDHFQPHTPGIHDEAEREKARHFHARGGDRRAGALQLGELRGEVREGEAEVVDDAPLTRRSILAAEPHDSRRAEQQPVGTAVDELTPDMIMVALRGRLRIRDRHMHVVVLEGLDLGSRN